MKPSFSTLLFGALVIVGILGLVASSGLDLIDAIERDEPTIIFIATEKTV